MLKGRTVNLSYGEKKALEKKYRKIMNEITRSKKITVSKASTDKNTRDSLKKSKIYSESAEGEDGLFFKYAYRYYYLLDLPAREAFAEFCECMRTDDKAKAAAYILIRGEADRDGLRRAFENASFEYCYGLSEKLEYIKKKCFGAKKGATT